MIVPAILVICIIGYIVHHLSYIFNEKVTYIPMLFDVVVILVLWNYNAGEYKTWGIVCIVWSSIMFIVQIIKSTEISITKN